MTCTHFVFGKFMCGSFFLRSRRRCALENKHIRSSSPSGRVCVTHISLFAQSTRNENIKKWNKLFQTSRFHHFPAYATRESQIIIFWQENGRLFNYNAQYKVLKQIKYLKKCWLESGSEMRFEAVHSFILANVRSFHVSAHWSLLFYYFFCFCSVPSTHFRMKSRIASGRVEWRNECRKSVLLFMWMRRRKALHEIQVSSENVNELEWRPTTMFWITDASNLIHQKKIRWRSAFVQSNFDFPSFFVSFVFLFDWDLRLHHLCDD